MDVVVVGSGIAGSWAAKELTEAGCRTLVLEAGPDRTADEVPERGSHVALPPDVSRNSSFLAPLDQQAFARAAELWTSRRIQAQHPQFAARGPHLFIDDSEHPYQTPKDAPYYWIRGMQVGGRSLLWGGSALRLSPYELDAAELDGCDLSWPVPYAELAEAYGVVESVMGLHGSTEGLAQLPDSVYRYESFPLTPAETDFKRSFGRLGFDAVPVRFISPTNGNGNGGWPGFTTQATALAAARETGRLVLRPNSFATEVTVDSDTGLASGVRYVDTATGTRQHVGARAVFLCGGTIETARLMLNSRSPRHPDGLGNSSGWVGRGLMDHPVVMSVGELDGYPHATGYEWAARQRGLVVPPRHGKQDGDVRPFGMWLSLQRLTSQGKTIGSIDTQGEMLPYWDNRVRLSDDRDRWGVPIPVIECKYGPHEQRLYAAMRRQIEQAAATVGLRLTSISPTLSVPGLQVHDLGTARMGSSPATSVLDGDNRCWDCPNVYVTDGACFPSAAWQNPTLTIAALSVRAARCAAGRVRHEPSK